MAITPKYDSLIDDVREKDLVTIGDPVSGGSANQVLYTDASGNVAGSNNFTYSAANLLALTSSAGITSAGAGTASEKFGLNASANGNNSTAIGNGATANFNDSVALGTNAVASAIQTFALGENSVASVQYGVAIGTGATANGVFGTTIGYSSTAGNTSTHIGSAGTSTGASVAIGFGQNSASSQLVIGSDGIINDVYIGNNASNGTPGTGFTIQPTVGSGTNISAGSITIAGARATGTGTGGDVVFKTSSVLGSGTTLQSLTERLRIGWGTAGITVNANMLFNAVNLLTDTTTGMKIGTATNQKIAFFNSTPIVQPGATTDLGTVLSNLGLRAAGTAYPITTSGTATLSGTVAITGNAVTADNVIFNNNAITAVANAATVPVTFRQSTVTNNSAAGLTITITTTSAVDGQLLVVRVKDFSAAVQTITWVNTENSTVTAPVASNGSTTLPLTVGFMYNSATTKWRCIASA